MEKRSPRFGQLLKAGLNSIATIEGKTGPIIDDEIGALVGLAGTSLQRYRSGSLPEHGFTKIVASACVRRGMMGRTWLEQFLKAAAYPPYEAEALITLLFPEASTPIRSATPRSNLPARHGRFVMRRAAYNATIAGLASETPLTVIVSLGGMGKSSLARAVAQVCLQEDAQNRRTAEPQNRRTTEPQNPEPAQRYDNGSPVEQNPQSMPTFTTVAWVSDKDRPGTTNWNTTLDEIARVLDYPGLMSLPFQEKLHTIEGLLRAKPILVVLDNAETISDARLLEWICDLPAPSKALATSRANLPEPLPHVLVELEPLNTAQARELIAERLAQSGWRARPELIPQLLPLAEVAGGNPKAIELALSLVLRQNRPITEAIQALRGASISELFDDMFVQAWGMLSSDAQQALLAMPLFAGSASEEALCYCIDVAPARAKRALTQLIDLSLLDSERADLNQLPRYTAHPLVRAFATARLTADPAAEQHLRARWLQWCIALGDSVGFCWDHLERLVDLDQEHETLQAALEWTVKYQRDQETLRLSEGIRYYYNVRGLWDTRRNENYTYRRNAAERLGNRSELVLALTQQAEVLSKQSTLAEAHKLLQQAQDLIVTALSTPHTSELHLAELVQQGVVSSDAAFEFGHARALLAYTRGELTQAETYWRELLPFSATLDPQKYIINRRWLATCLVDQGRTDEAAVLYRESLQDARAANDIRSITGNTLKLAAIDLAAGNLMAAEASLIECRTTATHYDDRRRLAECHHLLAKLASLRGDSETVMRERAIALDLFERMGMQREAAALRAEGL
jgi:tetratricopeptide (TPR) repeat protein